MKFQVINLTSVQHLLCSKDEALVPVAIELWAPEAGSSEGPVSVYTPQESAPEVSTVF